MFPRPHKLYVKRECNAAKIEQSEFVGYERMDAKPEVGYVLTAFEEITDDVLERDFGKIDPSPESLRGSDKCDIWTNAEFI